MKRILLILMIILTLFLFIGCKKENNPNPNDKDEDPIVNPKPDPYPEPEPDPEPVNYEIIVPDTNITTDVTTTLGIDNLKEGDTVIWICSDESIAVVGEDGVLTPKKGGNVTITAIINNDVTITKELEIREAKYPPIWLEGKKNMVAGEIYTVKKIYGEEEFDVEWSSSDPSVALVKDGVVFALRKGNAIIKAKKVDDSHIWSSYRVHVSEYVAPAYTDEEIAFAKAIVDEMTIDELIGQMFIGSYSGTALSSDTINAVKNYKLGNFIFMGNNTPSGVDAAGLATALQNLFVTELGIPGFISIDQETGRICRLTNGATRFLGNMASAATGDPFDRYLIGEAVGEELKTYGINFDLAPVLDVNNNPNNPVINNRSFSDSQLLCALYGEEMLKGLMSEGVMACAKHFPGHGDTATDSHYGLPEINKSLEGLYQVELAPFIHAIYCGIDAIMTTHILFNSLDSKYPATLSSKILTGLLRGELGFNGLIVTDGMEMQAITNNYGAKEAAALAVKAGADMICYTTISGAIKGITGVKEAYDRGEITRERLEESVMRIIIKKNKYNLFNENEPKEGYESYNTKAHEELNLELAKKAVTLYKGEFNGLDKTKKTIIFTSKCSYQLKDYTGINNSFGKYAVDYLKEKGMTNIDFEYISSMTNGDITSLIEEAKDYEQIVVAISDANAAQIKFVNDLAKERSDIIVISLNLPYDINNYNNVNTYICIYENTPIMIEALTLYMNGEYKATGKSPIKLNK